MSANNIPFVKLDKEHFFLSQHDINPPEGWVRTESFPNCCDFHREVVERSKMLLIHFPTNCVGELEYLQKLHFKKGQFDYIVHKVVYCLNYTEHLINTRYLNEDAVDDITEYVEYIMLSFGNPPIGANIYLDSCLHYIQNTRVEIPDFIRTAIIQSITARIIPTGKKIVSTDLNIPSQLYAKWFEAFPFDLPFFQPLKNHFSSQLPIVDKVLYTNRYNNLTTFTVHTEESMVDVLFKLTIEILSSVDTNTLVREGKITNYEKQKADLIFKEHENRTKTLMHAFNKKELKYIKTINNWLRSEIQFFEDIKSINKKALTPAKPKAIANPHARIDFKPNRKYIEQTKQIIRELQKEIEIVNEDKCSIEDLFDILFHNGSDSTKSVHVKCYMNQFAFIIDEFKRRELFKNMSFSNIEKSKKFFSGVNTKITAQLISSSKNQSGDPKQKDLISSIFDKFLK